MHRVLILAIALLLPLEHCSRPSSTIVPPASSPQDGPCLLDRSF